MELNYEIVMWYPGDPEKDLLGFDTRKDRDDFVAGKTGPFARRKPSPELRVALDKLKFEDY